MVQQIIAPTVDDILTTGKGEIVSVGFVISLWAGSSAMASLVDAITAAYDQHAVRNEVWQRIFALLLYRWRLVVIGVVLPLTRIGPGPDTRTVPGRRCDPPYAAGWHLLLP